MAETLQLTVYVNKVQMEDVMDCLLTLESISGFTFTPCFGHSREHATLNIVEQVRGSRELLKLDVIHERGQTEVIINALRTVNAREPMRYTLHPLLEQGVIEGPGN